MKEKKVINVEQVEDGVPKRRKLSIKRVATVIGIVILIIGVVLCLVFDISFEKIKYHLTKETVYSEEGTFVEGIPFSEVIDKLSAKNIEFTGEITSVSDSDKNAVQVQDGKLKITCSLKEGEALIFDRAGLKMKKTPDDFIVGGYATKNVSRSSKDSDVFYCSDAESVARVLKYNCNTNTMVLLWKNDIIFDKYLPLDAIINVAEFEKSDGKLKAIDPEYDEPLYDSKKVLVQEENVEGENKVVYLGFSDPLRPGLVVIIQDATNTYVVSEHYCDEAITECGNKHQLNTTSSIERILVYDYENALIQLVYESE